MHFWRNSGKNIKQENGRKKVKYIDHNQYIFTILFFVVRNAHWFYYKDHDPISSYTQTMQMIKAIELNVSLWNDKAVPTSEGIGRGWAAAILQLCENN